MVSMIFLLIVYPASGRAGGGVFAAHVLMYYTIYPGCQIIVLHLFWGRGEWVPVLRHVGPIGAAQPGVAGGAVQEDRVAVWSEVELVAADLVGGCWRAWGGAGGNDGGGEQGEAGGDGGELGEGGIFHFCGGGADRGQIVSSFGGRGFGYNGRMKGNGGLDRELYEVVRAMSLADRLRLSALYRRWADQLEMQVADAPDAPVLFVPPGLRRRVGRG